MNVAVLCSGRGTNLMALLEASEAGRIPGADFRITLTDNQANEALNIARERGLYAVFVPRTAYHANKDAFERRLLEVLQPHQIDLVVLAGFQRILGQVFLNAFPGRVINIHPALLPSFPGHSVWQKEVDHGVKLAGATVHFVEEGTDTGPIIIQGAVPVLDGDDADSLADRIRKVEHRILPQAVAWLAQGRLSLSGRKVILSGAPEESLTAFIWPPLGS
jgi:phosphoribosylglycinamide formyltransferase-1